MVAMGRFWDCTSCIGLLAIAVLSREAAASHDARYKIHRIEKEYAGLRRRDDTCNNGNTACPASLGGDCCPKGYSCSSTYCYATTAGPSTACGQVGYFNCGSDMPGQCCPQGYVCGGSNSCNPPAGQANSQTCPPSHYLCPSSVGGGCCSNGMGCGVGVCFSTNPTTTIVSTPTVITDSKGHTMTSQVLFTTTMTPSQASGTSDQPGAVPKVVATTVSRIPAIQTAAGNTNSTGLSSAALGGIVAGVVVVLLAVIVAAFIIVRRLRRTEKAVEVSKRGSSNGQQTTSSHKQGFGSTTVTEVDIDPLSQATPSLRPSHYRDGSDSSVNGRYSSPARSPPLTDGRGTPETWQGRLTGQYNPVPNGEGDGTRHPSMESMGGGQHDYTRYSQSQGPHRVSYDSQSTYTYRPGRQSNASEVSGSLDGQHGFSELDAIETLGRRRSSGTRATGGSRRQSTDTAYRGRSESAAANTIAPLEAVNEAAELHGYYGPQDKQVGQTAARPTSTGGPTQGR